MRRYWKIGAALAVIAATGSYMAFAQQDRGGMMQRGRMADRGSMMPMMRDMMGQAMAQSISQQAMVATPEGGAIVMAGGKLIKYGRDLNVVQEVDIQVNYEDMQRRMEETMESRKIKGVRYIF